MTGRPEESGGAPAAADALAPKLADAPFLVLATGVVETMAGSATLALPNAAEAAAASADAAVGAA